MISNPEAVVRIMEKMDITQTSADLFAQLAEDACNWGGTPLLDGNVRTDAHLRGNITQLKKAGLITTFADNGTWVEFTDAGRELAKVVGVDL